MADSDTTRQIETEPQAPRVDRLPSGKFAPGNKLGRGSPLAGAVAKLRGALLRAVKVGDVRGIITAMIEKAKSGDVAAAKLVLQYTLGEPQPLDLQERLEKLESLAAQEEAVL